MLIRESQRVPRVHLVVFAPWLISLLALRFRSQIVEDM
jgi:hypothetical protein